MKKIIEFILVLVGLCFALCGCTNSEEEYLRIHIRANSNSDIDQEVKYLVRDEVVEYLTPLVGEASSQKDAINIVNNNIDELTSVANRVLSLNGFNYYAKVSVREESFPTRTYGNLTLEDGVYDAVIVELGEGTGDNWWCVVFPPLCFVVEDDSNVEYKSFIVEILHKLFNC